ncbi:MAG TPA: formate--tetrahydrofolate ligase, partial [Turneriella sp.]|nr:formate--tetrahydrofolate ligase [Turneriella sp.]
METALQHINDIAASIGIPAEALTLYGQHKAKVPYSLYDAAQAKQAKLILVTSTTPNKAGVGKTTTSVALGQGMRRLGKNAVVALREPSLGPVFGMKGGATGGGAAQVHPTADINLHFNGDFHAITSANNLIAALADNSRYYDKGTDPLKKIQWKRALDMNDRALRAIITGLDGNGGAQETGFDITAASEIMAILCLATGYEDLARRINNVLVGYRVSGKPFHFSELASTGAVMALLKDAMHPNLVQSTEGVPVFVHGGPFANIAHGCNSIAATRLAMTYGNYAITEAGFGADLGAEKFLNIKSRFAGIEPALTVLATTSISLKLHGGAAESEIRKPNSAALKNGLKNLERHIENMKSFGQAVIVGYNRYDFDGAEEIAMVKDWCAAHGTRFALNDGYARGGEGAIELANQVMETIEQKESVPLRFTYELSEKPEDKLHKVVSHIYRGKSVSFSARAKNALARLSGTEAEQYPVCIAKTQYSFSQDPALVGVAENFNVHFEDIIVNSGAGFLVAVAGDMLRMPGLPKVPQAGKIRMVNGE